MDVLMEPFMDPFKDRNIILDPFMDSLLSTRLNFIKSFNKKSTLEGGRRSRPTHPLPVHARYRRYVTEDEIAIKFARASVLHKTCVPAIPVTTPYTG